MRIVGGKYRHRIIKYPDCADFIRPTKDRIREAIFNALGNVNDYISLDLYAGSGSMGIESLSRGCQKCYFVDINDTAIRTILENVKSLSILDSQYNIKKIQDFDALFFFKENNISFDLIFIDPPYKEGNYEDVVNYIYNNNIIKEKGIIVLESDHHLNINFLSFNKIKEYKYGYIFVTILWR